MIVFLFAEILLEMFWIAHVLHFYLLDWLRWTLIGRIGFISPFDS